MEDISNQIGNVCTPPAVVGDNALLLGQGLPAAGLAEKLTLFSDDGFSWELLHPIVGADLRASVAGCARVSLRAPFL